MFLFLIVSSFPFFIQYKMFYFYLTSAKKTLSFNSFPCHGQDSVKYMFVSYFLIFGER